MGLFRLEVREEMIERIPEAMRKAGFPVTRITREGNQTYYYFINPRAKTEINFWLTDMVNGAPTYLMMRISRTYKHVAGALRQAGILEVINHDRENSIGPVKARREEDSGEGGVATQT